jgi:hypothetical protein
LSGAPDDAGNLYVADVGSETVRKVNPDGVVTTVTDPLGLNGTDSAFNAPTGITIDRDGIIYVADSGNHSIRVGRPALPDRASIDSSTGLIGVVRQLDTTQRNATSWEWRIVRQPSGSTAALSSGSVRNPTFTPDVSDMFIFQVTATDGANTSISTVSLMASGHLRRRGVPHL